MIERANTLVSLVSNLAERRLEPVERPVPARDPSSLAPTAPTPGRPANPLDDETLERFLRARDSARGSVEDVPTSLRGRRAQAAYGALQYNDQRDYLAKVLGIDDYA